jgi:hypothetical protein
MQVDDDGRPRADMAGRVAATLWRGRTWAAGFVLLACLGAAASALMLEPVYQSAAVIEPGVIGVDRGGGTLYSDTPSCLAGKISRGALTEPAMRDLGLEGLPSASLEFGARALDGGDAFARGEREILLSCRCSDPELGRRALAGLIRAIEAHKKPETDYARSDLEATIARLKQEIGGVDLKLTLDTRRIVENEANIATHKKEVARLSNENRRLAQVARETSERLARLPERRKESRREIESLRAEIAATPAGDSARLESLLEEVLRLQDLDAEFREETFALGETRRQIEENHQAARRPGEKVTELEEQNTARREITAGHYPDSKRRLSNEILQAEAVLDKIATIDVIRAPSSSAAPVFPRPRQMVLWAFAISSLLLVAGVAVREAVREGSGT